MTTTTLLLLVSAVLIVAGVGLIWRDVHKGRRNAFVPTRDLEGQSADEPEVEISIARYGARPDTSAAPTDAGSVEDAAQQWRRIEPLLGEAVQQVNAVLAGAGVSVGEAGQPSWSLNQGYGTYRRLRIGGESLAWLRLELGAGGELHAGVKAHKDDLAAINAKSSVPIRGLSTARASDLLSECLKPAAGLAVQAASGGNTEVWASETAWKAVEPVVAAALQAAGGALAQAGARFALTAPAWTEDVRRHRVTVGVEVFGRNVARMHIERIGEDIEVAVGVPDARLAGLARRQRVAVRGLTTHALAELIAGCTWPAIAHFRELQHSA